LDGAIVNSNAIDSRPKADLLFPLWQIDRQEYDAVCAHLGFAPNPSIHARLNAYLAEAPFRFPSPRGFSRFLAGPRLTRFRVARLDQATRLIDRSHPVRHVLNAAIAMHECDADGYAQMSDSPIGARLLPSLAMWGIGFGLGLAITLPWLAIQFLRFLPLTFGPRPADLAGRRVLVTGAAHGLGRDVMLECLERGAKIIGTVRSEASRDELQALLSPSAPVRLLVSDLSIPGALVATLTQAGIEPSSLALAMLCAGVKHDGASVLSTRELRETFEVNLFSAADFARWLCATGADTAPSTGDPGHSRRTSMVLVSSMGRWHGMPSSAGYNASKAALSIWGESLEMELRRAGSSRVSVSIVEPGIFESGMTHRAGIARFLFVSRREVASGIVQGALAGKKRMRPPFWFALLTWAICLAGRELRFRLLGRAKTSSKAIR
jgi:NAD(P)-dependent dehydrogenase (short-subunit alcohol dehydrogenase family)